MTFFSLFPGLSLAYISVDSPVWPAPDFSQNSSDTSGPLLLNYCVSGRCEIVLNNGNFVYLKDQDFSLTECFAQKPYQYPRQVYKGLEFFIDIHRANEENPWLSREFQIDLQRLSQIYCPKNEVYISEAAPELKALFEKLWALFDPSSAFARMQMKIDSLALFSLLLNCGSIPASQVCTFFTEAQVDIAKRTEKIIASDLRRRHPAWELAARFSVSETSLKNYFRGVFGQNISVYLRELRMKKAAELFLTTRLSVSQVAEQVGYMNQSKFAAVFKKQFGAAPLEYKRLKRLEQERGGL